MSQSVLFKHLFPDLGCVRLPGNVQHNKYLPKITYTPGGPTKKTVIHHQTLKCLFFGAQTFFRGFLISFTGEACLVINSKNL